MDSKYRLAEGRGAWLDLLRLEQEPQSLTTNLLAAARSRLSDHATSLEEGLAWERGDIVHFRFESIDGTEDRVPEAPLWCAVQVNDTHGSVCRVDISDEIRSETSIQLLAAIMLERPEVHLGLKKRTVLLGYGDDESAVLASDLTALITTVEELGEDVTIETSHWEGSEQPDDFPSLRDLPSAASMYAD